MLADPQSFLDGTVRYNLDHAPRSDALSLSGLAVRGGHELPVPVAAVVTLGALTLVMWRLPRNAFGFALGAAFVDGTFNLVNKISFLNHWSLVLGLVVVAVAVSSDGRPVEESSGAP